MNSVAERLLESWLDNQTERRYQPAFIQMLVSEGWRVLHNTRHAPIELGKDVIARNPAGVLYCFQLKGNPNSRVTKSEAANLLTQFNELLILPPGPEFRKGPREKHVAVFVTNGEIDEEARLVFERAGAACGQPNVAASSYELWSRGNLLDLLKPALRVWPIKLEGTRLILNLLAGDGREQPVPREISAVMASLMPPADAKSPARTSALTSMFVVAEIIKARWYETQNHQALHAVTILASVAVLPLADTAKRLAMVDTYAPLALEHCADLLAEARAHNYEPDRSWAERDILGEFDVMWERRRLVADCAAILLLGGVPVEPDIRSYAATLVTQVTHISMLWGQAQIPSIIVAFWARSTIDAGIDKELDLAQTLSAALSVNGGQDDRTALAQPYYGFPDVWAFLNEMPHMTDSSIFDDTAFGHLHFGRALMFMLVKRNLKRVCRRLWPAFTQVIHEEPELSAATFFDAALTEQGTMRQIQLRMAVWNDLLNEAIDAGSAGYLDRFASLKWLLAAYVSLVPYRAWTPVVMWLDDRFAATWYHRGYRPR